MSTRPREKRSSSQATRSKNIGHYVIGKTIGEGTFGKVKLGTHLLTGEKVAIKILEKARISDVADVERVAREIHILKMLRHPNIIQMYEIIETTKELYLIMEYCSGGELFDYIVARSKVKEKEAIRFFLQIIAGVEYIHKLGVVHRDLKPENLLLDHNKNIKLVDFGLSNTYKGSELLKTACGSPCYAAPEMIAGRRYVGLQVDIWSCGVILFALIAGYLPFEDENTGQLYKKIMKGDFVCPKFLSAEAKDLLNCVLCTDPDKRYTIEQIRVHPWCIQTVSEASHGILVGYNAIPVDSYILGKLGELGLSVEVTRKSIEANKHNNMTTTYYLLLKKHLQSGGISAADVGSGNFTPTYLVPKPPSRPLLNQTIADPTSLETGFNVRHRRYVEIRSTRSPSSTGGSSTRDPRLSFLRTTPVNADCPDVLNMTTILPSKVQSVSPTRPHRVVGARPVRISQLRENVRLFTPRPPSQVTPTGAFRHRAYRQINTPDHRDGEAPTTVRQSRGQSPKVDTLNMTVRVSDCVY